MSTQVELHCATLLRELRRKKGLTLEEFEKLSGGKVKAVVLGSYERGTRAISLARLSQLSEIYQVPIEYFFESAEPESHMEHEGFIFDIRRIRKMEGIDEKFEPVKRYINRITHLRRDWNGEVLSLRSSDSDLLSLVTDLSQEDLYNYLRFNGLLFASEVNGQRSL